MPAKETNDKVVIVGAGIGGLAAALALLRRGIDVTVYEQASELKELGAGVQIGSNGTRVLYALGLADALAAVAAVPTGKEIRLWNTGQTWKLFDLGATSVARYGFPYITMHRGDLHAVLAAAVRTAKPDAICLGKRCVAVAQSAQAVEIAFADGERVSAAIAVGADGVHSAVRAALFGADAPVFTGILAWRGLIPVECLPPSVARDVGTNWVGPGGHVVHYPIRRGTLMNFVGLRERDDWQVESWTERGSVAECANDFRGWHEDIHAMIRSIEAPYKWALMARAPMPRWSRGRATLVGDACHPMLPFLAQGACMALEDAYVLARCLERDRADPTAALARYEAARIARTAKTVHGSNENARRFHNPLLAEARGAQTYVDREFEEARVKERYEWLFVYDATTVPI
jgi:salicylate hydroxylase